MEASTGYPRAGHEQLDTIRNLIVSDDLIDNATSNYDTLFVGDEVRNALTTSAAAQLLMEAWRQIVVMSHNYDSVAARLRTAQEQNEGIVSRLVETVKEMGSDKGYCVQGMSEFIGYVLEMDADGVKEEYFSTTSRFSVTVIVDVEHPNDAEADDVLDLGYDNLRRMLEGDLAHDVNVVDVDVSWG